jgi:hypothetical protein
MKDVIKLQNKTIWQRSATEIGIPVLQVLHCRGIVHVAYFGQGILIRTLLPGTPSFLSHLLLLLLSY